MPQVVIRTPARREGRGGRRGVRLGRPLGQPRARQRRLRRLDDRQCGRRGARQPGRLGRHPHGHAPARCGSASRARATWPRPTSRGALDVNIAGSGDGRHPLGQRPAGGQHRRLRRRATSAAAGRPTMKVSVAGSGDVDFRGVADSLQRPHRRLRRRARQRGEGRRSPRRSWAPARSASAADDRAGLVLALCLLATACGAHADRSSQDGRSPVWRLYRPGRARERGAERRTAAPSTSPTWAGRATSRTATASSAASRPRGKLLRARVGHRAGRAQGRDRRRAAGSTSPTSTGWSRSTSPPARSSRATRSPGATFLNDVAVAPDGTVLVADSGTGRIFAAEGRGGHASGRPTRSCSPSTACCPSRAACWSPPWKASSWPSTTPAGGDGAGQDLGQADGVARADGDNYFVSEWPGRLFRVTPDGKLQVLLDSRKSETYINDFIRVGDLLIVPNWKPGSLTAYRMLTWMLTEAPRTCPAASRCRGLVRPPLTGPSRIGITAPPVGPAVRSKRFGVQTRPAERPETVL